jgi:hypothetical protein
MRGTYWRLLMLSLILALTSGAAHRLMAQQGSEVTGTVSDPSGAAVPGASVEVTQVATGLTTTLTTDNTGLYYSRVTPGEYRIRVQGRGFQESVVSNIQLTAGHTVRQDVTLQLGATTQRVEVTAQAGAAQMSRESSTVSMILPSQMVQSLPVITRRTYEMLVTVPGVVFSQGITNRGYDASLFQPFVSIGGSPSGRGNIWIMNDVNIKLPRGNPWVRGWANGAVVRGSGET